jgi:hypothetical protein
MASKYLDGSMVPRRVKRHVDQRCEPREDVEFQTAVLEHRGRRHTVEILNLSASGAMLIFSLIPYIGETIRLQLGGRDQVSGTVCWVRDGRIGVTFGAPVC